MRSNITKREVSILMTVLLVGATLWAQNRQQQSIWQKLKNSAKQTGQNAAQQGTQQVQQGAQQVQQGAQQMQQQVQQQIPGAGGQGNAAQQSPCGSLTGARSGGGNVTNASYGSAAGSCGPQCFNAGPFAAAVTQMTMSQQGAWHVVRMNIQFHNSTDQPLMIAYRDGSMVMVDNFGNTYQPAGGYPGAVQGIGIDRGNQTDSQFVLGPGQTGNAMFAVARGRGNQSAVGSNYAYNFTIDELQPQNGAEAIAVRQYNLNFPDLSPGAASAGFGSPGGVPVSSPGTNVAGGGRGKASAIGAGSGYVGGAASGTAVNAVPTSTPNATSPRASATSQRAVVPPTRPGVAAQPGSSTPVVAMPAQRTVNNAALRTNAAVPAKPSPAAKPIPTKKPAAQQATSVNTK